MISSQVRQTFLDFFRLKGHHIVPSAPLVLKDDPTLMFTNAGMNQFKDLFLGNEKAKHLRIADTQKCLRVSGKHNDLEEVGLDTYHHTMFEMLGNWSFGDYFKKEAIAWAWELLTEVFKTPGRDLYVTVFGGDEQESLPQDSEAYGYWKNIIPEDKILFGSKKDNFWEMGDTGPCGPCSEIHIDMRSDDDKKKVPGRNLVNKDHPQVIEIWNLVFIEFNRTSNGKLNALPSKHVDTGMGFERLCMVLQGKKSNYDTDIFQPLIRKITGISGKPYGADSTTDIAMRVIADHVRAISFAIADGQIPSNTGAGYVIRRILRRAVRYGYTYLGLQEPFLNLLVPVLSSQLSGVFPELQARQDLIIRVVREEELSFLRTLALGIKRFEQYMNMHPGTKIIGGEFAFELFDTYGFPVDLTRLIAKEHGSEVDMDGFLQGLTKQKERSRLATTIDTGDWILLGNNEAGIFVGHDLLEAQVTITRYRKVKIKGRESYQLVFDQTPFYAESGGQVGDTGYIEHENEKIIIFDTKKEGNLTVHFCDRMPADPAVRFIAVVDNEKRIATANNHSATHLMHHALRKILGEHVEQKGSFVGPDYLRFDFSHFRKVTKEELAEIEAMVNKMIRKNIVLDEKKSVPFNHALKMGALAFFGEKYGEEVRVIRFGDSVELCGGTHVAASGQIGFFKILSESAIAAGIRRIEAITAGTAEAYINTNLEIVSQFKEILKNTGDPLKGLQSLMEEHSNLQRQMEQLKKEKVEKFRDQLEKEVKIINGINFIGKVVPLDNEGMKDLAFMLRDRINSLFVILGSNVDARASMTIMITGDLTERYGLHAGNMIRALAPKISGGGGGQPHLATAGGKNAAGLNEAIAEAADIIAKSH